MKELEVGSKEYDIPVRLARAVRAVEAIKIVRAAIQVFEKYQNPQLFRGDPKGQ